MKLEESYKILVDWSKDQHGKMQHFNTVNMAIHTLIITAIGYMVYHKDTLSVLKDYDRSHTAFSGKWINQ